MRSRITIEQDFADELETKELSESQVMELVGFAVVGDDFVLVYDEEELGEVVGEWGEGDFYVRKGDEG